jgi:hypothetical protein
MFPPPTELQHEISREANPEKSPTPLVSKEGSLSEGFLFCTRDDQGR